MKRAIAIGLKIPDNTAYTAMDALRRLGVPAARVERNEIYLIDDAGDAGALLRSVEADETIFNPNKHRLEMIEPAAPRPGEVWVQPLEPIGIGARGRAADATAWRLFDAKGNPASVTMLRAAVERLLCNPAIDRAVYERPPDDERDISRAKP